MRLIVSSCLVLLAAGCQSNGDERDVATPAGVDERVLPTGNLGAIRDDRSYTSDITQQEWLVERAYVNFAWGVQTSGYVIDHEGHVWSFTPPAVTVTPDFDHLRHYSSSALQSQYAGLRRLDASLSPESVREVFALIAPASRTALTDLSVSACDAGITCYSVLRYDATTHEYTRVVLRVLGDRNLDNRSAEAQHLVAWMNEVLPRD